MITLRPHQQQALEGCRDAFRRGFRAPLMVAPTGSGKTVAFTQMAENASAKGNSVLILAHRRELLNQTSRTLNDFDVHHGIIAAGMTFNAAPVQVASVQTLIRRKERLKWKPDLIIVDEAHHATGKTTWGKILAYYPGAYILGATATPERLDGQGLGIHCGGFFDAMVPGPSVQELVTAGYLSQPILYRPSRLDLSAVKTRAGDYARDDMAEAIDKPTITGDAVSHYRRTMEGAPAIAFCASVAHAEHVAESFAAAGYQAASIDGTLDGKLREERIRDLGAGKLNVLTSCEIISEGTDIPIVAGAILLRPTKSMGLYLQQCGRALRPFPGKRGAIILDHVGNSHEHGFPDDDRAWSLDAKKRSKRDTEDEPTVATRQCGECYHVHRPAPACPQCGFEYPVKTREIEHVDGELEQVDPAVERIAAAARAKVEVKNARTEEELEAIARTRGYKPGWVHQMMKIRTEYRGKYRRVS